jgi:hypothetical protein
MRGCLSPDLQSFSLARVSGARLIRRSRSGFVLTAHRSRGRYYPLRTLTSDQSVAARIHGRMHVVRVCCPLDVCHSVTGFESTAIFGVPEVGGGSTVGPAAGPTNTFSIQWFLWY